MNLYFEIVPCVPVEGPPKYHTKYLVISAQQWDDTRARTQLSRVANRVWYENNGKVNYVKNRLGDRYDPVDMKEFIFVKLRSVPA